MSRRGGRIVKPVKVRKPKPFVAFDGEGITREDGTHIFTLLASSVDENRFIENYDGLTTLDCLDYLVKHAELYSNGGSGYNAIFVSFTFSYDFSMILEGVTDECLKGLRKYGTVYVGGAPNRMMYKIEYIHKKILVIEVGFFLNDGAGGRKKWHGLKGRKIKIYDVLGFFQTSFVKALKTWNILTPEELALMDSMKAQRADFSKVDPDEIRRYNWSECQALVRLCDKLRDAFEHPGVDLKLASWHGAGAVANAMFKKQNVAEHLPKSECDEVRAAYFGGRIQCIRLGHFEDVYTYDIRSAYPAAMAELPHFENVEPVRVTDGIGPYDLVKVKWNTPGYVTPFPFRCGDKSIQFYSSGIGWYHACEYFAAVECLGNKAVEVLEVRRIPYDTKQRPFEWIGELYEYRKQLREAGDEANIAVKLALNSLYGKLAQKIGRKKYNQNTGMYERVPPQYRSYMLAGAITAWTRAKMFRAAMQSPDHTIMFATDGIATTEPLKLELGEELGQWEETFVPEFRIYQPGMYLKVYGENDYEGKTRSIPASAVDWDYVAAKWEELGVGAKIDFKVTQFTTYTLASKSSAFRQWYEKNKILDLYPRKGEHEWQPDDTYRLRQIPEPNGVESSLYDGGNDPEEIDVDALPWEDWV